MIWYQKAFQIKFTGFIGEKERLELRKLKIDALVARSSEPETAAHSAPTPGSYVLTVLKYFCFWKELMLNWKTVLKQAIHKFGIWSNARIALSTCTLYCSSISFYIDGKLIATWLTTSVSVSGDLINTFFCQHSSVDTCTSINKVVLISSENFECASSIQTGRALTCLVAFVKILV